MPPLGPEGFPWEVVGAVPEMFQTAWGSVFKELDLQPGERLLIRSGSTSVGLAAADLPRNHGAYVLSTTRQPTRATLRSLRVRPAISAGEGMSCRGKA